MNKILRGIKTLSSTIGFSNLPKEKRQITFYSEGKNYWPHLQGLLEMTLEKKPIINTEQLVYNELDKILNLIK